MRFFLEREIASLYEFLKTLDEGLDVRRQKIICSIDVMDMELKNVKNDDGSRKELINLKIEAERVESFTNLLRQSFLTSLYSFMELWLMRECHLHSKRNDGGQSYRSTKGKGIEKAKRYFKNVMRSDYPFGSSQDWIWITNFQLLRDCIIHRQGSLTGFSDFDVDSSLAYSDEVGHRIRVNPATPRSPATQGLRCLSEVADFRPISPAVCAWILL